MTSEATRAPSAAAERPAGRQAGYERQAHGSFRLSRREFSLAAWLSVLVLAYGVLTMSGHQYSSDGFVTFQSARILVTQGTLFFEPPLRWGDQVFETSKYGLGMTVAYLAYLIPLRYLRPDLFSLSLDPNLPYDQQLLYNDLYLYASTLNALVVAGIAALTYLTARELGLNQRWAAATGLVAALASPLAVYARLDFSQPLATLCLLAALWCWLRARTSATLLPAVGAGLGMAAGILTRFDFTLVVVPGLVGLALHTVVTAPTGQRRRLISGLALAGLAVSAALSVVLIINAIRLGSPLAFGYPNAWNTSVWPMLRGLIGHLFSPGAGLLWHFPLAALSLFSLAPLVGRHPVFAATVFVIVISHLVLYSVWRNWPGGYAWGPRFLVPLVPLLTIIVMLWAAETPHPARRWWVAGGVAASWLISLNGILFSFLRLFSTCKCLYQGPVGSERFMWAGSTLISGWYFPSTWEPLSVVTAFDLLWLNAVLPNYRSAAVVVILLLVLALAAVRLTRFVRTAPPAPAG